MTRRAAAKRKGPGVPSPLDFFAHLKWLDGKPLLDTIEQYRRKILTEALFSFEPDGRPKYNLVLCGRGKKNYKTTDLVLACFYPFFIWKSSAGNDVYVLANDEKQAGDDLKLANKLIEANSILAREVDVKQKSIERRDGLGTLEILPARDVAGQHGKTFLMAAFDEIHAYRDWALFEALAPDPSRPDALTWICSYDTALQAVGVPLHDLKRAGLASEDPRMYFSWYSGDYTTDGKFAELEPELKANPSLPSWPDGRGYLEQQKRRLPTVRYRRLHLNLGAIDGAYFDPAAVIGAIVPGRKRLLPREGVRYAAFVDMSGGSSDDAVLGIAHLEPDRRCVLDVLMNQGERVPFNPRHAVARFAKVLKEYGCGRVHGDRYAGETFRADFFEHGISYQVSPLTASELYEDFEPRLNAGEVELVDINKMQEQFLTLITRGNKIDHTPGEYDDWSNACAGAIWAAAGRRVADWAPGTAAVLGRLLVGATAPW